jgi:hypothetical protein
VAGSWKFEGFDEAVSRFQKSADNGKKVFDLEIYTGFQRILTAAKVLTPRDTGSLRASGNVQKTSNGVEIAFSTPYAAIVHEDMSAKNWTTSGTGPKYLERPFGRMSPDIVKRAFEKAAKI